jgi:hypothetical protein
MCYLLPLFSIIKAQLRLFFEKEKKKKRKMKSAILNLPARRRHTRAHPDTPPDTVLEPRTRRILMLSCVFF